jgi:hypothetical protein
MRRDSSKVNGPSMKRTSSSLPSSRFASPSKETVSRRRMSSSSPRFRVGVAEEVRKPDEDVVLAGADLTPRFGRS